MRTRSFRRVLTCLLALLLTAALPALPAQADGGELRTSRPKTPMLMGVGVVYGTHVQGLSDGVGDPVLSHDGGATWQKGGPTGDWRIASDRGNIVTRLDDGSGLEVFSLADGLARTYRMNTQGLESANSTHALFGQYLITLEGSTRRDLPTQAGGKAVQWSTLLPNGHVVSDGWNDELWSLSPGGVTKKVVSLQSGFEWVKNWGNYIAYAPGSGDPCLRTVDGDLVGCSKYLGDDYRVEAADAGFLVQRYKSQDLTWLPLADGKLGAARTVRLGSDVRVAGIADQVEGGLPVISTITATASYLERLDPTNLTTKRTVTGATRAGGGVPTALTPTDLLLQDSLYTADTWQRAAGKSIGSATLLSSLTENRSSAQASAGRWMVPASGSKVTLYDRGSVKETVSGEYRGDDATRGLSGPNLMVERNDTRQVRNSAGTWATVPNALGVFGALVLEDITSDGDADEGVYRFRVRNLSVGSSSPIEFSLPGEVEQWWGDNVAYEQDAACYDDATQSEQDATVVYNFRTGKQVYSTCGDAIAMGDGFVVVGIDGDYSVRNLSSDAQTSLGNVAEWRVAVDGNRVAYATETELVIKTIPGVGRSAPRSLGVKAPASYDGTGTWTPEIDLTKPVGAGNLVIKNAEGAVVRSLAVPASADGSIRGVGWDGKDAAGSVVPKGNYTIELTNAAADGTGTVVRTDGTAGALATVAVGIATLIPGTPTIEGTAKVGATLTAKPGDWRPAPVSLAYQWKRDGKVIPGATAATYKVTPTDAGTRLTVTVTGKSGTLTASRTSAPTESVPGAKLITTPTPKISGTAKVGKKLTAKPGTWKPSGVIVSYQWYRNGRPITGAVGRSYELAGADKGTKITVRITGAKTGYTSVTRTSKATKKVAAGTLTKGTPKISGVARVGSVLTAKPGAWKPAPVTLTYQWYRSGKKVSGATALTYTLTSADKGKKITMKVTGTKPGYTTASKTSKKTAAVKA